jgi:type IV secretion system protein VirB4
MRSSTQRLANQDDVLSRHIPMSARITSSVVSARTGDYMSTWEIDGLAFDGLSIAEAYAKMEAFNVLVRSLSNGKFAFWVHRLRRFTGARLSAPTETFAQHVVEKYYEQLNDEGLMATEIYLTILYRPFPQKAGRLSARKAHTVEEMRHEELEILERMGDLQKQVSTSLAAYGPTLLTDYENEGVTYSRQQEFYGYLINGAWQPVPVKDVPLYHYLSLSRVLFGNEIVETRGVAGTHYSAFIDIKDYAEYSEPGILNTMIALPFEYIETQSFSPKHTMDALAALRIQRRRLASADDGAVSQIVELDAAIDGVISGSFAFGEYHYVMQILGDTVKDVKECRAIALERMQSIGFLGVPVDLVVDQAYLSQLPGNWRARPRSAHLSSRRANATATRGAKRSRSFAHRRPSRTTSTSTRRPCTRIPRTSPHSATARSSGSRVRARPCLRCICC